MTTRDQSKYKGKVNWRKIKTQFETGAYTIDALSELHGIPAKSIAAKAREGRWTRDREKIVEARATEMIEEESRTLAESLPELGIELDADARLEIEIAARVRSSIILRQQKLLASLHVQTEAMLQNLIDATTGKIQPEEFAVVNKGMVVSKRRAYAFLGEKESMADYLSKISSTAARIVPLTRLVFGIDDDKNKKPGDQPENPIELLVKEINGRAGLIREGAGDLGLIEDRNHRSIQ